MQNLGLKTLLSENMKAKWTFILSTHSKWKMGVLRPYFGPDDCYLTLYAHLSSATHIIFSVGILSEICGVAQKIATSYPAYFDTVGQ